MKIAQVAPLWERVPPPGYGGIELVVGHLTDELVRRGHDVTLFASGDSQTLARLESVCPTALRLNPEVVEPTAYDMLLMARVMERSSEFDIIHFHNWIAPLPFTPSLDTACVHTLHNGFAPENRRLFEQYRQQNYITLSHAQQQKGPDLNYFATVRNGISMASYPYFNRPAEPPYLAFLGRMSPQKGPHLAIAIAKQAGWTLKMAGKIDKLDREFFDREVAPHIDGQQIQYLGETSHEEKAELLGNATATLFPITWDEPFGLVPIESMATGTPVLALNKGAVPETVAHAKTGFIANSIEELATYVGAASLLNRQDCRDRVFREFSVVAMTDGYEAAYQKAIVAARSPRNGKVRRPVLAGMSL